AAARRGRADFVHRRRCHHARTLTQRYLGRTIAPQRVSRPPPFETIAYGAKPSVGFAISLIVSVAACPLLSVFLSSDTASAVFPMNACPKSAAETLQSPVGVSLSPYTFNVV